MGLEIDMGAELGYLCSPRKEFIEMINNKSQSCQETGSK